MSFVIGDESIVRDGDPMRKVAIAGTDRVLAPPRMFEGYPRIEHSDGTQDVELTGQLRARFAGEPTTVATLRRMCDWVRAELAARRP